MMNKYTITAVISKTFKRYESTDCVLTYATVSPCFAEKEIIALKLIDNTLAKLEELDEDAQKKWLDEINEKHPTANIREVSVEIIGYTVADEDNRYKFYDIACREMSVTDFLDMTHERLSNVRYV